MGLSSERLARIDRHLQERYIEFGEDRGGGRPSWLGTGRSRHLSALGDRTARDTMTDDTIFRFYSMTKPITSVALMMLVE